MRVGTIRRDERLGLGLALALHAALLGALLLQPEPERVVPPPPERMVVNLATEADLASTAPDPVSESRMAEAPTPGEAPPAAAEPEPAPEPAPQPAPPPEPHPVVRPEPAPRPSPTASARPSPRPTTRPTARPTARPTPRPAPQPTTRPSSRPTSRASAAPAPRSTPTTRPAATASRAPATTRPATAASARPAAAASGRPAARASAAPARATGGSRIGDDFLAGAGSSTTSRETRTPAAQIGASARAALSAQITRELRPHWAAPQGADAEQLVTVLAFNLNPDGSLAGRPRVVSQSGVTPANEAQKALHAERAIRAVQLAAPFDLPEEHYEAWRRITSFRFDRRL
ncbi:TonB C-terminal domain-containing protein [Qipengyuania sp. YIM B01966]|uniref:TonB C-terminal domain-containing protein n=1 Tax=Qipengyuania sp. YIM B01966 TaxID=2778646 RepID=UPI0018F69D99|nr:TonB C-terminal domain-containing protein [Qipengyuania sp. YIM B01966]